VGRDPGEMPSWGEYDAHGRWSPQTVLRYLTPGPRGTWRGVAQEAGLTTRLRLARGTLTPESIIADYQRVAAELGLEPGGPALKKREFDRRVPYTAEAAAYRFGTWTAVSEAAGFVPGRSAVPRGSA
jgi:hypothetical protein